jgi:hypothetical protein
MSARYRAGVIGLGWMGLLSDLGHRPPQRYEIDDIDRPTPELDIHRRFHFHQGQVPHSWAEVMWERPEVDLVAGAERDPKRLRAFGQRYGIQALYEDATQMLRREQLDIVAIATNTKGRAELTCLAVQCGVRGIATEKPMVHTLAEADRMVEACAVAGVPLSGGAIPLNHPAFARARKLLQDGAIGELLSIEAEAPFAQKQYWSYFVDGTPAWVIGSGRSARRDSGSGSGSDEFGGQGMMVTNAGQCIHFRKGAGLVRLSGSAGEMSFGSGAAGGWQLWQDIKTTGGRQRVEVPWPPPQIQGGYNAVFGLEDIIDCLEGRLDEPKNSGRRVAVALEVEIGLKQSADQGGQRVDLPLEDRSLGLNYDWFR